MCKILGTGCIGVSALGSCYSLGVGLWGSYHEKGVWPNDVRTHIGMYLYLRVRRKRTPGKSKHSMHEWDKEHVVDM